MTEKVVIVDVLGINMHVSNIVMSLQCKELELTNISLNQENTILLVDAMERVRRVLLVDVTLEIEELCKYSGKGQCAEITVGGSTKSSHSSRLKIWSQRVHWIVKNEDSSVLTLTPKGGSSPSSSSSAKKVSLSESDEEDGCFGALRRKFASSSSSAKRVSLSEEDGCFGVLRRKFAIAKACYDNFQKCTKYFPTFDPAQIAKLLNEDLRENFPEKIDQVLYIKDIQSKLWMILHVEVTKIPKNQHTTELVLYQGKYEHILENTGKGKPLI